MVPYQTKTCFTKTWFPGRLDATLQDDYGRCWFLKSAKGKGFAFAGNNVVDAKTLGVGAAIGFT